MDNNKNKIDLFGVSLLIGGASVFGILTLGAVGVMPWLTANSIAAASFLVAVPTVYGVTAAAKGIKKLYVNAKESKYLKLLAKNLISKKDNYNLELENFTEAKKSVTLNQNTVATYKQLKEAATDYNFSVKAFEKLEKNQKKQVLEHASNLKKENVENFSKVDVLDISGEKMVYAFNSEKVVREQERSQQILDEIKVTMNRTEKELENHPEHWLESVNAAVQGTDLAKLLIKAKTLRIQHTEYQKSIKRTEKENEKIKKTIEKLTKSEKEEDKGINL